VMVSFHLSQGAYPFLEERECQFLEVEGGLGHHVDHRGRQHEACSVTDRAVGRPWAREPAGTSQDLNMEKSCYQVITVELGARQKRRVNAGCNVPLLPLAVWQPLICAMRCNVPTLTASVAYILWALIQVVVCCHPALGTHVIGRRLLAGRVSLCS
jgi:hypothetical protein